jgi:NitT/TauT family transport system substrate-binding protein
MKKILYIILALALTLAACGGEQQNAGGLRKIKLPMGYIPNIQYAPFYVAVEKGYFAKEGIEIEFDYKFETDGIALTGAGEIPFTVASGEQVLIARAQELPVVYIYAWYKEFPISVVSTPELNIKEPADLRGKTIGLPGPYGANYIGLEALLFSAGLTADDVKMDSIGFNQVETFAAGQQNVIVGYAANEPIVLKSKGFEVSEMRVADYQQLTANGIVTSEMAIKNEPDLVRQMARAFAQGITDAAKNPEEAYNISLKYVENLATQDKDVQMQILNTSIEFWETENPGTSNPQAWKNMNELLAKMKLIPAPADVDKAFTNEFVP